MLTLTKQNSKNKLFNTTVIFSYLIFMGHRVEPTQVTYDIFAFSAAVVLIFLELHLAKWADHGNMCLWFILFYCIWWLLSLLKWWCLLLLFLSNWLFSIFTRLSFLGTLRGFGNFSWARIRCVVVEQWLRYCRAFTGARRRCCFWNWRTFAGGWRCSGRFILNSWWYQIRCCAEEGGTKA